MLIMILGQATLGWDPGICCIISVWIQSDCDIQVTGLGTPNFGKLREIVLGI